MQEHQQTNESAIEETYAYNEQPATCPLCGNRTTFDQLATSGQQRHRCLTSSCQYTFMLGDN
ncbi:hypothetical protein [Parapedobacter sp. DT-150]|uniref:hypothetical protein n=1 Tax=Parapedobacter sp. DT-150 TaxID=3396162 RepID=UPI003F1A8411